MKKSPFPYETIEQSFCAEFQVLGGCRGQATGILGEWCGMSVGLKLSSQISRPGSPVLAIRDLCAHQMIHLTSSLQHPAKSRIP